MIFRHRHAGNSTSNTINTRSAWRPLLRPVAHLVIAAQLAMLLQPFGAVAQQPAVHLATTTYTYDETGAKTGQVDALGRTTTWTLDPGGRITARKIQDNSQETSSYDSVGNRIGLKTFAGEQLGFQYDMQDRLSAAIVPQGFGGNSAVPASTLLFKYNVMGQIASVQEQGATSLNGIQTFTYDVMDRLITSTSPVGRISYTLDAVGNILEDNVSNSAANAGTTRREYDIGDRLTKVIARDGKQTVYTYDASGRVVRTERDLNPKDGQPQTLVTHNRYDAVDHIVSVAQVKRVGSVETLIAGQALTRRPGGTITRISTYRSGTYDSTTGQFSGSPARTQALEYDPISRLTRETVVSAEGVTDTRYAYDAVGNRTSKTVTTAAGIESTTYSYDSADRLTQESVSLPAGGNRVTTYSYDGNGNLAQKAESGKVALYRFDPRNRLIDIRLGATLAAAQAASPSVSYAYDAGGNRIRKGGPGVSSYLIDSSYGSPQLAIETQGTTSTAYVRGLRLIRQTRLSGSATQDIFPLQGHLGTSLGAVDVDGTVIEQVDADAFGNLDRPTGLLQTHLYAGEYWDQDAQMLYLRARWYDPKIGRFISPDPFEGKQSDPRSLNRYSYAYGDPVHNVDPTGEMTLSDSGAAVSTTGALNAISLPTAGLIIATARTTHFAVASVPFMAMHGQRVTQFIQGSGRAGFEALQRSVFMISRGVTATQQQIQGAWNVGPNYTSVLNQTMGARASQYGFQIHRLLEGAGSRLPPSVTQSLANMAPTPVAPHLAISRLHSSNMFLGQSMTVRQYLISLNNAGRLSVEQWFKLEAEIWSRAMQGQQLTPQLVRELIAAL